MESLFSLIAFKTSDQSHGESGVNGVFTQIKAMSYPWLVEFIEILFSSGLYLSMISGVNISSSFSKLLPTIPYPIIKIFVIY